MKYCSKCKISVSNNDWLNRLLGFWKKFCYNCGEPTETVVEFRCVNKRLVSIYDKFCPDCGQPTRVQNEDDAADERVGEE